MIAASIYSAPAAATGGQKPHLRIEAFRGTRAYVSGMDQFSLAVTIRNAGDGVLPADMARAGLTLLSGLEYVAGDAEPKLPELAAGASVTFRWRVAPSRADGPLAASIILRSNGQTPVVRTYAIPRINTPPPTESAAVSKTSSAEASPTLCKLENERIRARVIFDQAEDPILLFSVRTSGGWRQIGASLPLAELEGGESRFRTWWEHFDFESARAANLAGQAKLTLSGIIGINWKADVELTIRSGSAVLDAELRLAATRPSLLMGARFLPLLAGEGSFGSAASETLSGGRGAAATHRAVRWGEITVGTVNRAQAAVWTDSDAAAVEAADYRFMGSDLRPADGPLAVDRGHVLRIRSRLFALAPSAKVSDALTVAPPESTESNGNATERSKL